MLHKLKEFVPFVGNTHDLQNRKSDTGAWFLRAAVQVSPRIAQGKTSQGRYVFGADGTAYAFNNNRSVERFLAFADHGLAGFRANPPRAVALPPPVNIQPAPPQGTSILRVYSRIRPAPAGCDPGNENLQRDHYWILPSEIESLSNGSVPESLALRLCRFALVDAVRGEPDFWKPGELVRRSFRIERPASGRMRLLGSFSMATADRRRGLEGGLEAELRIIGDRLAAFRGYAEGTAWGEGTYTPGAPPGKFPIKFAFVLAPRDGATVAPQAAMYGREYLYP